jgi:hypothetical protein
MTGGMLEALGLAVVQRPVSRCFSPLLKEFHLEINGLILLSPAAMGGMPFTVWNSVRVFCGSHPANLGVWGYGGVWTWRFDATRQRGDASG